MLGSADGQHWQRLALPSVSSITAIAARGRQVTVVGLDGLLARSDDGARHFKLEPLTDGASLTAVLNVDSHPLLFSRRGVLLP